MTEAPSTVDAAQLASSASASEDRHGVDCDAGPSTRSAVAAAVIGLFLLPSCGTKQTPPSRHGGDVDAGESDAAGLPVQALVARLGAARSGDAAGERRQDAALCRLRTRVWQ